MIAERNLFDAHTSANTVAGHLLQAYALQRFSGRASYERQKMAVAELDKLAEMFGLELVPRAEVRTR